MANIWLDKENELSVPKSAKKGLKLLSTSSALRPSTKKNVLGDLNNLIHNKQVATPMRSGLKSNLFPSGTKSLCNDVLRSQQRKVNFRDAQCNLESKLKSKQIFFPQVNRVYNSNENIDIYDYMDFPGKNCTNNCSKPIGAIWSENSVLDQKMLEKLIKGYPEVNNFAEVALDPIRDDLIDEENILEPLIEENHIWDMFSNQNDFKMDFKLPDIDNIEINFPF